MNVGLCILECVAPLLASLACDDCTSTRSVKSQEVM